MQMKANINILDTILGGSIPKSEVTTAAYMMGEDFDAEQNFELADKCYAIALEYHDFMEVDADKAYFWVSLGQHYLYRGYADRGEEMLNRAKDILLPNEDDEKCYKIILAIDFILSELDTFLYRPQSEQDELIYAVGYSNLFASEHSEDADFDPEACLPELLYTIRKKKEDDDFDSAEYLSNFAIDFAATLPQTEEIRLQTAEILAYSSRWLYSAHLAERTRRALRAISIVNGRTSPRCKTILAYAYTGLGLSNFDEDREEANYLKALEFADAAYNDSPNDATTDCLLDILSRLVYFYTNSGNGPLAKLYKARLDDVWDVIENNLTQQSKSFSTSLS